MNHRPFEDWLLEERTLSSEETLDLQAHINTCSYCASLAEVNLALHAARPVAPAPGFTARFQSRLVTHKKEQRWRVVIGLLVLTFGGLSLAAWHVAPFVSGFLVSPLNMFISATQAVFTVLSLLHAFSQAFNIVGRVLAGFISQDMLAMAALALGGLSLFWVFSIEKYAHSPQGVSR